MSYGLLAIFHNWWSLAQRPLGVPIAALTILLHRKMGAPQFELRLLDTRRGDRGDDDRGTKCVMKAVLRPTPRFIQRRSRERTSSMSRQDPTIRPWAMLFRAPEPLPGTRARTRFL